MLNQAEGDGFRIDGGAAVMLGFLALATVGNAQPASADLEAYQYSLVSGKLAKGSNVEGECAGNDEDSDFGCWSAVHRAKLTVHRTLGGKKASGKIRLVYVSHAGIRDDESFLYLLKKRPAQDRYILERLYPEKSRGRSCLTQEQIDEVSSFGVNTARPIRLCPIDED